MSFANRIRHILIAAFAALSLFASSVSACSCSHHLEQAKTETPSCHFHSHEASPTVQNASPASADAPCECVLVKPSPAIIAKSEKKKLRLEKNAGETWVEPAKFKLPDLANDVAVVEPPNDPSNYLTRHFTGLLPARAPPRL